MTGVYLAYAIDQADYSRQRSRERIAVSRYLQSHPDVSWVFDPGRAFKVGHNNANYDSSIRAINRKALDEASVLVALLPAGVPSVGVPMEIERALGQGKKTLVISDAPSWMLQFEPGETGYQVPDLESAVDWLDEALRTTPERTEQPEKTSMPVVLSQGAEEPRRGYDDDAGIDLVVEYDVQVYPGQFVDIPCGVSVQLPPWSWGMITGRSSTLRKRGLLVNQGVIDAGYRGPLFAGVWNLSDRPVLVKAGERVAQLIILENATRNVQIEQVQELEPSKRGTNGFGSTGT
jgi:dUTP pyrophosphatase